MTPGIPAGGTEDLRELVRSRNLELIVSTIARRLVRTPAQKDRRVSETRPLHVVVLDLADALDPKRFPGQILARAPAALTSWHACHLVARPFAPWVAIKGMLAPRGELSHELFSLSHRESRRHAHMVQPALVIVQSEQQRTHELIFSRLVPSKTGDDAVGSARVFDLDHRSLARLVLST